MADAGMQAFLDRQAITDVLMRYCRGIDRMDAELLRSVYHPGARDDHGIFDGPAEEFIPWALDGLRQFEATQHMIGNMLIEVDGEQAWGETYVVAYHRRTTEKGPVDHVVGGRYADRFERRNGEWRIADRKFLADWSRTDPVTHKFGNSGHGRGFVGGARDRTDPSYQGSLA